MTKCLVVEDNSDATKFDESIFTHEQLDVVVAEDGYRRMERARAESPDLIITDISMPRLSGGEMIRRLRQSPEHKHVPIWHNSLRN